MTPMEIVLAVGLPYMFGSMLWFLLLRNHEPIKSREWPLALFGSCLAVFFFLCFTIGDLNDPNIPLPCAFRVFPGVGSIPGLIGARFSFISFLFSFCTADPVFLSAPLLQAYLLRAYLLFYKHELAKARSARSTFQHWTLRFPWSIRRPFLFSAYFGFIALAYFAGTMIFLFDTAIDRTFIETTVYATSVQRVCSDVTHMYLVEVFCAILCVAAGVALISLLWSTEDAYYMKVRSACHPVST